MEEKQTIGCLVDHCKYYDQRHCTLDSIKVVKNDDNKKKEATRCDSYKAN